MKLFRTGVVATFCLAAVLATAAPASAKGGDDVRASGKCSAGSTWKMKAKPDDGRIEVELEVDSNRVGQLWSVALSDNGTRIFTGNRRTTAPSGSFEVELRTANRAGADRFTATARTANGEVCSARVTL
jgi:hypothetical protein